MRLYPLSLKLAGKPCVVVGGGKVAERKVVSLLECEAAVTVVSPETVPALEERAARGEIRLVRRAFQPEDVAGACVVIAATSDRAVNEAVVQAAHESGALVNVVDVPDLCDFYVPACVNRGSLQVTVSTSGAFPLLSKRLRQELEALFAPEYEAYLELLCRLRKELKARAPEFRQRVQAEADFLNSPAWAYLRQGKPEEAERVLTECLSRFPA